MKNWATDPPADLRRAHRAESIGRGLLPTDLTVKRIKGALVAEPELLHPKAGTLIWWHGGGFVAGHPLRALAPAAWVAATGGIRCVLPLWPLAPETIWPEQASHARNWCNRYEGPLAIAGDSAGGALALACADLADALVLAYPALGAPPGASVALWGTQKSGLDEAAVKMMYARLGAENLQTYWQEGLPRCLVLTGEKEPLADDLNILMRLGTFETHLTPGAGHGFLRDAGQDAQATKACCFAGDWLKESLIKNKSWQSDHC